MKGFNTIIPSRGKTPSVPRDEFHEVEQSEAPFEHDRNDSAGVSLNDQGE